jgi:cation diffusion facilitator family transporter
MVTFFIGGALVATGLGLAYGAIRALHTPPALQISGWVGVAALLSVFVKEGMFQWTMRVAQRTGSMALVANAWHHRSDALSSVPVFIAVVAVHFEPSWGFLDPVGALIVSAFILRAAWDIFLPAMQQLMDEGASVDMQQRIIDLVRGTEGVCSMHKLRTRYIGHTLHVDLHIQVDPQLSVYAGHAIAHHVKDRVMAALVDVADVLIHVEPYDPARH